MKLNVAICDDEDLGIQIISRHLETFHFNTGIEFSLKKYNNPLKLNEDYNTPGLFDIIFLDVEMPIQGVMYNGLDIAKKIRELPDQDVRIIFISNYPSYMQMGYDVQASYYLEKDVSDEKFARVLNSVIERLQNDSAMYRIRTDIGQWNLIRLNDIQYIESFNKQRNKVVYHTTLANYTETGRSILSISADLTPKGFAFANKYHLVNMNHVVQFTHDCLQLDNKEYIEISRHYRKDFLAQFSKNIISL